MLKKSGESSTNSESIPCRDDSPWLQDEQSRKTRKPSQEKTKDMSRMKNPGSSLLDQGKPLTFSEPQLSRLKSERIPFLLPSAWLRATHGQGEGPRVYR